MAAAPADFRAAEVAAGQAQRARARSSSRLEPTEDILAGLAAGRGEGQTIVGFAAEHGEGGVERAREKLERKGADLIVLNDVSDPEIGFESERERGHPDRRGRRDRRPAWPPRTRSPTRSSTGSTRCEPSAKRAGYTELKLFRP